MKVLFLHNNFPAQYRHVAQALSQDPNNQVVFGTQNKDTELAGISKSLYELARDPSPQTHHYVRPLESAALTGQSVCRMAMQLKAKGFIPDLICGHSGWGPTMYVKDVFPDSPLLCYYEWFYHAYGSDADFDPESPLTFDDLPRIRTKNAPILIDLYTCDRGLSPTFWQRSQFPPEYHDKISVMHDGVDTDYFVPEPGSKLVLPNADLSHVEELVTYVSRGMEPYRGFPQFMQALAHVQERRPKCHVAIVASERVCYGKALLDGKTYKDLMLEQVPLDLSRIHFLGTLPYGLYRKVLQASDVHVYLTRPFVLSWSMIESMSSGCLVVGSATPPVMEVIEHGKNGLLFDFFSPQEMADRIDDVLDHPDRLKELRINARKTALERYDLKTLLPKHLQLMQDVVDRKL
jgi:glycosyltransferase involved in cell wall biosynthesis